MRKLLLTSSQVSVLLTCFIALLITSLLFGGGVLLQHRTVSTLRSSLAPSLPSPPSHILSSHPQQQPLSALPDSHPTPWSRLAHVQVVTQHSSLCSALLVLSALSKAKSPARRILFFPASWAADAASTTSIPDPYLATSRRLLRLAARKYGVELRAVDDEKEKQEGGWLSGLRAATEGKTKMSALERVVSMPDVDRVLLLRAPGRVLNAGKLDGVLAWTESGGGVVRGADGMVEAIFVSNGKVEVEATEEETTLSPLDDPRLKSWSALAMNLTVAVGRLHDTDVHTDFDAKAFVASAPYLSFRDPLMPQGPDFDVPFDVRVKARPKNRAADELWTRLYGDYTESRREVCGLALESWYD